MPRGAKAPKLCPAEPRKWTRIVSWGSPSPRSDRKSTRLNSSHLGISYAVFCLKKKKKERRLEQASHRARAARNRDLDRNALPRGHDPILPPRCSRVKLSLADDAVPRQRFIKR